MIRIRPPAAIAAAVVVVVEAVTRVRVIPLAHATIIITITAIILLTATLIIPIVMHRIRMKGTMTPTCCR